MTTPRKVGPPYPRRLTDEERAALKPGDKVLVLLPSTARYVAVTIVAPTRCTSDGDIWDGRSTVVGLNAADEVLVFEEGWT